MSTAVLPTISTVIWAIKKTPTFSTLVQRSTSGKELRAALMSYPQWEFEMSYELLRDDVANNELKNMMSFFLARQGSFDNFNYLDPDDNTVTTQIFGAGDGVTTTFQLARTFNGAFTEPVFRTVSAPSIFDNASLRTVVTHYNINAEGLVTFVTAPAAGHVLTWTGQFYFRVRFKDDANDFEQFMQHIWQLKSIKFCSDK
jgi:uncharacterized protein (TIGR02217 family)